MLNIGFTELLMFSIIALLVLGPEKLPEGARFVGKWYGKAKRLISNVQNDLDRELRVSELREQMQIELKRIQQLEAKMQQQMDELQQPIKLDEVSPDKRPTTSVAPYYHPVQTKHPSPLAIHSTSSRTHIHMLKVAI